jgi:hypothetical protein
MRRTLAFNSFGLGFVHRPGFQTTRFPCERVWQGSWEELTQAIEDDSFSSLDDTTEHLDRVFLIRASQGQIDLARSPADVLALEQQPRGQWYAGHGGHSAGCLGARQRP